MAQQQDGGPNVHFDNSLGGLLLKLFDHGDSTERVANMLYFQSLTYLRNSVIQAKQEEGSVGAVATGSEAHDCSEIIEVEGEGGTENISSCDDRKFQTQYLVHL